MKVREDGMPRNVRGSVRSRATPSGYVRIKKLRKKKTPRSSRRNKTYRGRERWIDEECGRSQSPEAPQSGKYLYGMSFLGDDDEEEEMQKSQRKTKPKAIGSPRSSGYSAYSYRIFSCITGNMS